MAFLKRGWNLTSHINAFHVNQCHKYFKLLEYYDFYEKKNVYLSVTTLN